MVGYRQFHHLSLPAFSKTISRANLLVHPQFEELVDELQGLLESGVFGIIYGDMGVGKTTSLRYAVGRLEGSCQICYTGSMRHPTALLQGLVEGLGLAAARHRSALLRQLSQRVERTYNEQRKKTLMFIDDSHLLDDDLLEDLRLLTNFGMDGQEPLAILLVGHPALRRKLQSPVHLALWDRVGMHYHLGGLSAAETAAYIDQQMRVAGGSGDVFTSEAKAAIFEAAQGIPRRINALALMSLKKSAARRVTPVDETLVAIAHDLIKTN